MKIAILYICTGKYGIFWNNFYKTSEQYFYPEVDKTYFVFTDDLELMSRLRSLGNVHCYFQRFMGWPYDTLMRFNIFSTIQDLLINYDYCYYWNANAVFVKPIDESVIPFPNTGNEIVLWRHTLGYDHDRPEQFNAEKNPESEAYVQPGTVCHSYGGGFFGGTSKGFVKMSNILRDRVARDLEKGIIATQHDQSHVVKYGTEIKCVEVPKNVIVSEEYAEGRDPYVVFTNKQHYGGMHILRDMPLSYRLKIRIMDSLSNILGLLGIKRLIKGLIG